ncbi:hypothetical protein O181_007370 [Austropuccinia psidii MF-1]|uniref:Uncharacterized protein n=1 Tax=Austropuccinia psidii MF-1 TaxID=1389203 RepID=A0A9Q3BMT3_9BASI|nr:hypothetical protein [Austropuccinia psidii MF-1]
MPSYGTFYLLPENSFSKLENSKNVSSRTSSQASIDSESSDEQTNPPPQISSQAVPSQCQHKKNNRPISPPPKVAIPLPAPSVALHSSRFTTEERSSEESDEVPHSKVNPDRFSRWLFRSESPIQPSPKTRDPYSFTCRKQTKPPSHDHRNLFWRGLKEMATSNTPPIHIIVRKVPIQAPPSSAQPKVTPTVPPSFATVESEPQKTDEELLLELAHPS